MVTGVLMLVVIFIAPDSSAQKLKDKASPELDNGIYTIKVHNLAMEIDPALGARITTLKLDGKNFLTGKEINNSMWGSTFWPSPQADWNWPPSPELDNKPYTAVVENNILKMVSQKDPKFGWVVTKEFSGNKKEGSYTLKFTITNNADKAQKVAPWEVTRVHINGLMFFPIGKGEKQGGLIPAVIEKDGICWFPYDPAKLPAKGDRQLYTDGSEGWLAQVNDGVMLLKTFPDVPLEQNAPSSKNHPEGEIELFASMPNARGGYVEIEHQGPYVELQPGASTTWEIKWFLKKIPAKIRVETGNPALTAFARKIAK